MIDQRTHSIDDNVTIRGTRYVVQYDAAGDPIAHTPHAELTAEDLRELAVFAGVRAGIAAGDAVDVGGEEVLPGNRPRGLIR